MSTFTGDRPSAHGAWLGKVIAALADLGEKQQGEPIPPRCATCAFRDGTVPNQSAGTGLIAMQCVLGIDNNPFGCHHGMENGRPTKLCSGYAAACRVPFETLKAAIVLLHSQIAEITRGGGNDALRDNFDAWLREVDPNGTMDVYEIARAFEKSTARRVQP